MRLDELVDDVHVGAQRELHAIGRRHRLQAPASAPSLLVLHPLPLRQALRENRMHTHRWHPGLYAGCSNNAGFGGIFTGTYRFVH